MIKISYYTLERMKSDISFFFANSRKEKEAVLTHARVDSNFDVFVTRNDDGCHDDLLNAPTTALIVPGKFLPRIASDFTHVALAFDFVAFAPVTVVHRAELLQSRSRNEITCLHDDLSSFREVFADDDENDWRERIKRRSADYARLDPIKRETKC